MSRRPLRYRRGADVALDRPAHVRAASALAWVGGRLLVVQDDAAFLGVVEPATGLVDDVVLPTVNGRRVFDKALGNKADKPDLEAAFADGETLVACGSGGPQPARRVVITWRAGEAPKVLEAGRFLDAVGRAILPAATALNLEGAALVDGEVWLANRGGDRDGEAVSPDAIVTVELAAWRAYLADPAHAPVPALSATRVELGSLEGCPLHFAELVAAPSGVYYLAAAEATASYFDDGAVVGSVLGLLRAGAARYTPVLDEEGVVARDKLEGLAAVPGVPGRWFAVVDADDPDRPADLLELSLAGDSVLQQ